MRSFQAVIGLSLLIGITVTAGHALHSHIRTGIVWSPGQSPQASGRTTSKGYFSRDGQPLSGDQAGRLERSREEAL